MPDHLEESKTVSFCVDCRWERILRTSTWYNRTAETASLFYSGDRTSLKMYDCTSKSINPLILPSCTLTMSSRSDLVSASYITLAALCPNLENLSLELCGRLDSDTLIKWGMTLDKLKVLDLWGPFNVRKEGWIKFLQTRGHGMEGLLIT
jgi:DNA repair protein RAD7